jgi:hypothetical protein
MNLKLNLLKIAPLVTTIAVGVFAPIEMVNAASGSDHTYVAETTQQEVVKKSSTAVGGHEQSTTAADDHEQSSTAVDDHEQSTTAADDHEQSTAAVDDHEQSSTAVDDHEQSTAAVDDHEQSSTAAGGHEQSSTAAGGHEQSTATMSEILTSPKAQQIEFFSFLSIIGLSLVVPEIFYRPKKEAQKLVIVEKNQAQGQNQAFNEKDLQQYESRDNQQSIKAELAPTRLINLNKETEATEKNTSIKKDLPSLKVVSDSPTPYTIPNKEIGQIQTNGKVKLDNWSQPNRDAA